MSRLAEILRAKRDEVAEARLGASSSEMRGRARSAPAARGFLRALRRAAPRTALIAEIKRASPSRGLIRPELDPEKMAACYARAGAHALSVLTDRRFFHGSPEDLKAARAACELPVLRKDFTIDPYQVLEARALGADAVLLIVAALDRRLLAEMAALAAELGMDSLVEVHTEEEAETALELGFPLVGVNCRDLATFETSSDVTRSVVPKLSAGAFVVAESALESRADVRVAESAGARAVLIGTAFCEARDVEGTVKEVMGW